MSGLIHLQSILGNAMMPLEDHQRNAQSTQPVSGRNELVINTYTTQVSEQQQRQTSTTSYTLSQESRNGYWLWSSRLARRLRVFSPHCGLQESEQIHLCSPRHHWCRNPQCPSGVLCRSWRYSRYHPLWLWYQIHRWVCTPTPPRPWHRTPDAPPPGGRHSQNGLAECHWKQIICMAHILVNRVMPKWLWLCALRHVALTSFELSYIESKQILSSYCRDCIDIDASKYSLDIPLASNPSQPIVMLTGCRIVQKLKELSHDIGKIRTYALNE